MAKRMNPVQWFEIPVNDLSRAREFYEYILETQLSSDETSQMKMLMFSGVDGAEGSSGALVKGEQYIPSHDGSVIYFTVHDIERVLDKVQQKGGKVLVPKTSIGKWGNIAHFEDSEGNRVALWSD